MTDKVHEVAAQIANVLGNMVNDDQISPPEVVLGASRGVIAFWMGCMQDGARADGMALLKQGLNEEIDNITRGMANGMVPV